jgi:acyl homoserine lactone synthase
MERLSAPQRIGQTAAVAGFLHDSDLALEAMYRHAALEGPVLVSPGAGRHAA